MTDDEIRQSRIDHGHQLDEIVKLVREGTPSRVGRSRLRNGMICVHYYDWREITLEPRRR